MFSNKYLLMLSAITTLSFLHSMDQVSERTRKMISQYEKNYKEPSAEFVEKNIIPIDNVESDYARLALFNEFIYRDLQWKLQNNSYQENRAWIDCVTAQRETCARIWDQPKDDRGKILRKAAGKIVLCKHLNLAYLLYAGISAGRAESDNFWKYALNEFTGNRLDDTTVETIFDDMSHYFSAEYAMKFNGKISASYSQKIEKNNGNYVSPLEVKGVKLEYVLEVSKQDL